MDETRENDIFMAFLFGRIDWKNIPASTNENAVCDENGFDTSATLMVDVATGVGRTER